MWNCYYADASTAVAKHDFMDIVFADDLNCTKAFPSSMANSEILDDIKDCQAEVHKWGEAWRLTNQKIVFMCCIALGEAATTSKS